MHWKPKNEHDWFYFNIHFIIPFRWNRTRSNSAVCLYYCIILVREENQKYLANSTKDSHV